MSKLQDYLDALEKPDMSEDLSDLVYGPRLGLNDVIPIGQHKGRKVEYTITHHPMYVSTATSHNVFRLTVEALEYLNKVNLPYRDYAYMHSDVEGIWECDCDATFHDIY